MLSLDVLALAAYETSKISIPTIVDGMRGLVDPRVCDRRLFSWARHLVAQARIRLETTGLERIEPGKSYIVMSNHQSHYDIPILFEALGIPIRMVAKTELFRIPIMGPGMRAAGFVELDRGNRRQAIQSLSSARARLIKDHISLWIAPEGTRSKDGSLQPFKRGGFHLALEAGLSILPVSISGSIDVHRAHTVEVHKGKTVRVAVSSVIDPAEYGRKGVRELMEAVRAAIAQGLDPS